MSKTEGQASKKMSKKEARKLVYTKLVGVLAEYNLEKKKLETKLKKASKLFAADIAKAANKATPKTKKLKKVAAVAGVQQDGQTVAI